MDLRILVDRSMWKLVSATLEIESITAIIILRLGKPWWDVICSVMRDVDLRNMFPNRLLSTVAGFNPTCLCYACVTKHLYVVRSRYYTSLDLKKIY
ncbi:hypothetical protein B296_00046670 [Ensete ventricosum]|uniref:Uncharacterized protein n=1 Tax=Ensete ventricosum TaxID=4639 RepID=A0A426XDK8_ENSVE|nr:hypothetical protein B296_00046670 [Ensete ventricosum]